MAAFHRPDHPVVGVEEDHVEGHAVFFIQNEWSPEKEKIPRSPANLSRNMSPLRMVRGASVPRAKAVSTTRSWRTSGHCFENVATKKSVRVVGLLFLFLAQTRQ